MLAADPGRRDPAADGDRHRTFTPQAGEPIVSGAMKKLISALAALAVLGLPGSALGSETDWLGKRTMNIAHQGGEDEAPSNTMYALQRSLLLGGDMLEVDIHATADGQVVAIHDGTVDRTTDGSGEIYDMTLEQVQRLDSAYNFVPGVGTEADLDPSSYPFRGVRTGERRPPKGFGPRDFRIPTLEEIMRTYPDVPINIEIKGRSDEDLESYLDNAEHLAETLTKIGRTEGIIVASFNDVALDYFHELMPEIDLAPAIAETAAFKLGGVPPGPGRVAFQVPITFESIQVTDDAFVEDAHAIGLAVHVWLSNDPENDDVYRQLLDWNVDGVMPAAPTAFERVLCERGVARPPRPESFPGDHCRYDRVSIACDVAPAGLGEVGPGRRVDVVLRRTDEFTGQCAGKVRLRAGGRVAKGRFDFGLVPPSEGGPAEQTVTVELAKRAARRVEERPRTARVRTRAYHAYGARESMKLVSGQGA